MIQQLIYDRFGVYYNVFYIAQLLKNLGLQLIRKRPLSRIISMNSGKSGTTTWPQILRLTKERKALLRLVMKHHSLQWGT